MQPFIAQWATAELPKGARLRPRSRAGAGQTADQQSLPPALPSLNESAWPIKNIGRHPLSHGMPGLFDLRASPGFLHISPPCTRVRRATAPRFRQKLGGVAALAAGKAIARGHELREVRRQPISAQIPQLPQRRVAPRGLQQLLRFQELRPGTRCDFVAATST